MGVAGTVVCTGLDGTGCDLSVFFCPGESVFGVTGAEGQSDVVGACRRCVVVQSHTVIGVHGIEEFAIAAPAACTDLQRPVFIGAGIVHFHLFCFQGA